jgi:hypothetical protein
MISVWRNLKKRKSTKIFNKKISLFMMNKSASACFFFLVVYLKYCQYLHYMASGGRLINDELDRIWKEAAGRMAAEQ